MLKLLNAGFGFPLSADDLALIKSLGFDGVRQDLIAPRIKALVDNILDAGLFGIFIVSSVADGVEAAKAINGRRAVIEFVNEPDIDNAWNPVGFASQLTLLALKVWPVQVLSGGISTLSAKSVAWLEAGLCGVPQNVDVAYHTYASENPAAEFARLKAVTKDRKLWQTEVGWSTAPMSRGFPLCWLSKRLTDEQVLANLKRNMELNEAAGAESWTLYQLNDGHSQNASDHFGIRTVDGVLKPQAHLLRSQ